MEETNQSMQSENKDGTQKKNGKKTGIVIGVAAAAVVIGVAATQLGSKTDPKTAVIDAFKSVVSAEETSPMEEIFGWKELSEKMRTSPYETDFEMQLDSISDTSAAAMATGKLFVTGKADPASRASSAVFGVGYAGMDLVKLEAYMDDSQLSMSVPELSAKAFSLNYKDDLAGQMDASPYLGPILKEGGMDAEGISDYLKYVQDASYGEERPFDVKALWKRYREGSQALASLKEAMTAEKGDKKQQTIDGKEETVQGYTVFVPKEAFADFLRSTKEFMMSDETFKNDFMEYVKQVQNIDSMYSVDVSGEVPDGDELWNEMSDALDQSIDDMIAGMGDLNATVYVRKDGKMASYEAKTTVSAASASDAAVTAAQQVTGDENFLPDAVADADQVALTVSGVYSGGYSLGANSTTTMTFESGGDAVDVVIDRAGTYDKELYSDSLGIEFASADESFKLLLDGTYGVVDSTYTVNGSLSSVSGGKETELASMSVSGIVSNLEKGQSFNASMDSVTLTVNPAGGEGSVPVEMALSGNFGAKPLEGGVDKPEGEPMDVLAATEDDWNGVAMEMFAGAMGLLSQVQQ